jgi:hypothetical protein
MKKMNNHNVGEAHLKKLTNEQFVANLMSFHPSGALIQSYVIEALRFYSKMVAKQDPADFKDADKQFVNPNAWRAIGIDVFRQILRKYGATADCEAVVAHFKAIDARIAAENLEKEEAEKSAKKVEIAARPKYDH